MGVLRVVFLGVGDLVFRSVLPCFFWKKFFQASGALHVRILVWLLVLFLSLLLSLALALEVAPSCSF
jgi:hypothetical protein